MRSRVLGVVLLAPLTIAATHCSSTNNDESTDDQGELRRKSCPRSTYDGPRLSEGQIAGLARRAGFPESMIGTVVCTAIHESDRYTHALNTNCNGSVDYGLFQINSVHLGESDDCPRSADALLEPLNNTRCAYAIYAERHSMSAWYGYKSHKRECDNYRAPRSEPLPSDTPSEGDAGSDAGTDDASAIVAEPEGEGL